MLTKAAATTVPVAQPQSVNMPQVVIAAPPSLKDHPHLLAVGVFASLLAANAGFINSTAIFLLGRTKAQLAAR
jgi:hypothetical protein